MSDKNEVKELDIFDFIDILKSNTKPLYISVLLFTFLAAFSSFFIPNQYTSSALLTATEQLDSASSRSSGFSGLASFAGVDIPQSAAEKNIDLGLEILKSRSFKINLIKKYQLEPILFASKKWDGNKLIIDGSIYDKTNNQWIEDTPTDEELVKIFTNMISIEVDKKTGFITLKVTHISPNFSKEITELLIKELNTFQKQYDLKRADKALNYLYQQSVQTSIVNLKNIFNNLIESQLKKKMLADISEEYFLTTIDAAVVPLKHSFPNRAIIILFGSMLGFLIGLTFVIFKVLKKNRS